MKVGQKQQQNDTNIRHNKAAIMQIQHSQTHITITNTHNIQLPKYSACQPNLVITSRWLFMARLRPQFRCPRALIAARCRGAGSITMSWRASCCCSSAIAGIAIRANFKMYLLRQFCSNRVKIFLQYTGDTDAKNDGPEF